jgi:uncharacterized integral membrane protein (TIGR00698 family)
MSVHPDVAAPRSSGWLPRARSAWPGLLLSAIVAVAATFISDHQGGPTLLYALLLGMALHQVSLDARTRLGIDLAAGAVLRIGVALLGARITLEQLGGLGWQRGGLIAVGVVATIGAGVVLARLLGLERRIGVLTGGATAICGASAAIAIAAVLPRDARSDRELTFTIAGVTALSTLAMIAYPVVGKLLGLTAPQAGIFLGGTIHDVAQVVGAGYSVSTDTGDMAVLTKMLRVAMLLPVVVAIAFVVRRRAGEAAQAAKGGLLPGFLLAFAGLVTINSLGLLPAPAVESMNTVSRACLVMAIAAVGLKTSLVDMRAVGGRAMILLGMEALFLAALVLAGQGIQARG